MKWRRFFEKTIENWPVKIIALALAIFIVVLHQVNMQQQRFFSAPLRVQQNSMFVPSGPVPANVRISIRGSSDAIYPVMESDIEAYIDLTRYTSKGAYRAPVQIRRTGTALSAGTIEIRVEPSEISVEVDANISKYVPIVPLIHGEPASGFVLLSHTLEPSQVQIEGPAEYANTVTSIRTAEIDITGRSDDFSLSVTIASPGNYITINGGNTVQFSAAIRANIITKSFDMPVTIQNLAPGLDAKLATTEGSFSLQGRSDIINNYTPLAGSLFVDLGGFAEPGDYRANLYITPPSGMVLQSVEPAQVDVQITAINDINNINIPDAPDTVEEQQ
jgi:YbbR domain-containing protein